VVAILTQSDLRHVRDLPFCHACAKVFLADDLTDRDHIPAQACFDKADRNPPLKLKSHVVCNNAHKLNDEKVGELIAVQRRKSIDATRTLRVGFFNETRTGRLVGAAHNLDIMGCIKRWVRGFHAALYREPLSPVALFQITPPLPHAIIKEPIVVEPIPAHVPHFVQTLKLNRAARNLDRIVTNNGKLRFESVWAQDDHQKHWMCIWALDLYGWIGLGDQRFRRRGCTGAYMREDGHAPDGAARATRLEVSMKSRDTLDAFGD
jgi:hypothetical protein